MTFENHTECECGKLTPTTYSDQPVLKQQTVSVPVRSIPVATTTTERTPNDFVGVSEPQCKCDCQSKQTNDLCIKLKLGIESFSIDERK